MAGAGLSSNYFEPGNNRTEIIPPGQDHLHYMDHKKEDIANR